MALSEGMMAVVRSVQEASGGLCVTLLEGDRQYTLLPNSAVPPRMQNNLAPYPPKTQSIGTQKTPVDYNEGERPKNAYDHSAQAVDGQYASVYKMAHCNLRPTSPPVELTEFPPQRPEVCPGQENFVIGGASSGYTNPSPPRNCSDLRVGTNWPARGTARCSRPPQPDAFASTLRNYPPMCSERSSEVVERLVNYSNIRNNKLSPDRQIMPKNNFQCSTCSTPTTERFQQMNSRPVRGTQAEIYPNESPTRDRWHYQDERRSYPSPCDVRSITEERMRDFHRNYPVNLSPMMKEGFNHISPEYRYNVPAVNRQHSANMETQVVVPTVSREMTTVPRTPPKMRNVAVFVSPATSSSSNSVSKHRTLKVIRHSKSISIQTKIPDVLILRRKSVQTCFSSVNIGNNEHVRHKRRSKSQDELKINDDLDEEIVQFIEDFTKPSVHLRSKLKKLRKHKHDKKEVKVKNYTCEKDQLIYSERNLKEFTRELSNDLLSKLKRQNIFIQPTPIELFRANYFHLFIRNHEQSFVNEIVIEWLNDIPIKSTDYLGRPVVKEHILKTVGDKVRNILMNKLKYSSEASTKTDIIDILEDMPIDISGHNRRFFLNNLVTELMSKVKDAGSLKESTSNKKWKKPIAFCNYIQPTNEEIKQFIENEVTELQRKFNLIICHDTVGLMINELAVILLDSGEAIRQGKVSDVIDEILTVIAEFLTITEFQSIYFAHNLVYNLFPFNCTKSQPYEFLRDNSYQEKISNRTDFSIENETDHVNTANKYDFTKQIAVQVNEWLSNIKGIEKISLTSRLVAVNDLTSDIVDRQKYLQINPSLLNAGVEELEHLKYQIFKWVNKVLGEDNTDTLAQAPDLMTRIKSVPMTMTKLQEENITVTTKPSYGTKRNPFVLRQEQDSIDNASRHSKPDPTCPRSGLDSPFSNQSSNVPNQQRRYSSPDGQPNQSNNKPVLGARATSTIVPSTAQNKSNNQLNEEYDAYVKDWVRRVPIAVDKPEDEEIAEKARLGLYIGVWKAVTKLKMSPETLDNPYHYQDALDDELEVLLQCLPQTPEFKTKKHLLKPELIEKTMVFNERVANVAGGSSYRQQLVDNVNNNLPKQTDINVVGKNVDRLYEEWQKMMLAELYILYNRYKNDDKVKAMAYKKKLMRHVDKMIDNIKATTKQELKDLDHHTYQDEILAALDEVPIPSDETLNEEASEILILLEVEQWFRDLPLLPSERATASLEAKVFQDLLARKLYDIDTHCNPTNRADLMKQEIRRFLERLPLREEEKPNMNFMIEELINRLNNVNSDVVITGGENKRKSITFLEGYDYDAFSRNLPVSSTFQSDPPRDPNDGSSYLITEGVRASDYKDWQTMKDPTGEPEQYFTIEGLTGPRMATSSAFTPTPRNGGIPPENQFLTPNQRPFRTEKSDNDVHPGRPSSGSPAKNGQTSSRFIQLMDDHQSDLTNQNRGQTFGPPARGNDPNRLRPPSIDINEAAMPQQYRTSPMPTSQRVDCCTMPTPQDDRYSVTPRPQDNTAYGMPRTPDNEAFHVPRSQIGTCPMPRSQQPDCCGIPSNGASAMPRSQDNRAYSTPRPQEPGAAIPGPQDYGESNTPQDHRTLEQGTNPIPTTLDNATTPPCCKSVRRSSAPSAYRPGKGQCWNRVPVPDQYSPCSTPDTEDQQPSRKDKRERRESARRKISFEDSENESDTEFGCRCMEKLWRCRRKPVCEMRGFIPCEDLPCFMRMRRPCYYRS